jgi:hypothetical protein
MIATCLIMYAMATAHWTIILGWLNKMSSGVQETLVSCLVNALDGEQTSCTPSSSSPYELRRLADSQLVPTCAPTVMLAVNVRAISTIRSRYYIYTSAIDRTE